MAEPSTDASVVLWGREVAAVSWLADRGYAVFQYDPEIAGSGIELSPLVMPLSPDPYSFSSLPKMTFKGLPGMLADALPDTVDVSGLVRLANLVLNEKASLEGILAGKNDLSAIDDILRVGTSAGGARAKAILAWNEKTGEFRHGQIDVGEGFEHWLMKFDGVDSIATRRKRIRKDLA